ncbi:hypothetical protein JTE90_025866 [Oedothorax gibbosus]|uniref:Uncharacterized protein n=1 Tax=Oedothorax gibbosus TaxID=931172 RepID=A0AAV6ULM4_9ARAC|nr:hypothetical protein JTE90_025866 [Oedothorax gibbosus]
MRLFSTAMIPLVSFLAALRLLTDAQSCNNGLGKFAFELVMNYRMGGNIGFGVSKGEVVTLVDSPLRVLQTCKQRCEDDPKCLSFDFTPGQRVPDSQQPDSVGHQDMLRNTGHMLGSNQQHVEPEYKESVCHMYHDRASPDGGDVLVRQINTFHFNKICFSSTRMSMDCPKRLYVIKRTPGHCFESLTDQEIFATNRTECEDKCIEDTECLSACFDRGGQKCRLSRNTKAMNPTGFISDSNSDYVENMCLSETQACPNRAHIMESGKRPSGAMELETIYTQHFQSCSDICSQSLETRGYLCTAFYHEEDSWLCTTYMYYPDAADANEMALAHETSPSLVPSKGDFYRILCGNADRDAYINNATVECFRRKRLDVAHQVEVKVYSFQECLDECMRRYNRDCQSVEYSSRFQSCRFSSQSTGPNKPNLVDDESYDYYEFKWIRGNGNRGHSFIHRPGYGQPPAGGAGGYGGPSRWGLGGPVVGGPGVSNPSISQAWPSGPWGGQGWSNTPNQGSVNYPAYPPAMPPVAQPWGSGNAHSWSQAGGYPPVAPPALTPHQGPSGFPGGFPGGYPQSNPFSGNGLFPPAGMPQQPFPNNNYELCKPGGGAIFQGGVFRRVGFGTRLRSFYVRRVVRTEREEECEKACLEEREFVCLSFNFRNVIPDNCELSDQDTRHLQLNNPGHFEQDSQFDFYERDSQAANGIPGASAPNCIDVSQSCSPDGIEFTMKTPEGFYGRIYTYGFYDSCFYDGNGGTTSVLRISRGNGFPRCGTQQYGDVMTNIVVVQFNDNVQTSRDKKYNLTCYMSGPGETVVTSSYMDTRTDGRYPTQIEHLPAQNMLTSNIVLRVLYRGAPTNTIAVGDLLTFRLEARGHYHYEYFSDIFATNVIAKDPYSGRQVHLIDNRGCPVDLYVFPELQKTPDGALQADFYAFKIPDSNLLVFQATVRTCRGPCEPVICSDRGRPGSFPSWGRKKRFAPNETAALYADEDESVSVVGNSTDEQEVVHDLLKVYLSRSDMPPEAAAVTRKSTVCVAQAGYYTLVILSIVLVAAIVVVAAVAMYFFKKAKLAAKAAGMNVGPPPGLANLYIANQFPGPKMEDPSEPIYTDPSLFEQRARSNRNVSNLGKTLCNEFN